MATKKKTHRGAKNKVLNTTLYTYVRRVNRAWVLTQARRKKVPYSVFVDRLISNARNHA